MWASQAGHVPAATKRSWLRNDLWYDTLSVLVAEGRVSVAASGGGWSKRIRDTQYTDHDDYTVGA